MAITECFVIEKCAPITQYQDLGRFGHLDQGFSYSGAMDEIAFRANNHLLNNADNATQLEIAPGGLRLRCLADCTIAISGAYLHPTLNGKPLVNFCAHNVVCGDVLAFGFSPRGVYAYLAISGGFAVTPFLGSTATTKRLGVFPDGELNVGSVLSANIGEPRCRLTGLARDAIPDYSQREIDVYPAYQFDDFSKAARTIFTTQQYVITSSDRMGTRLTGDAPLRWSHGDLLSEGIVPGAIQIANDGQPIVLQKDAQSIGGYPKIGVLTAESCALLAQIHVGQSVRFGFVSL